MMWRKWAHRGAVATIVVAPWAVVGACDLQQTGALNEDASVSPDATPEGGPDSQTESSVDDGPTSDVVDGGPPFNPSVLGNLELWLKADEGLVVDSGGVLEWQDQSGKNDPARNAIPGVFVPPQIVDAGPFGTAVAFASNQGLRTAKWDAGIVDPTTIFVVAGKDPPSGSANYLFDSLNGVLQHGVLTQADNQLIQYAGAFGKRAPGVIGKPMSVIAVFNGGQSFILRNANHGDAGNGNPGPNNSVDGVTLGSYAGGSNLGFGGYIAEFALYSRLLTDPEIAQLNAYASKRYGIVIQ